MDGVSSDNISHTSSHGPTSAIRNAPCSHLLGIASYLQMYYAKEICKRCYASISNLQMCHAPNPYLHMCSATKFNGFDIVNVHNYFIQVVHLIKWSSFLNMRRQNFIARCRCPSCFVPTLTCFCRLCMSISHHTQLDCILVVDVVL